MTPDEKQNVDKLMQEDKKAFEDPRTKPGPDAGKWAKFKWATMYPLYTISAWTIPGKNTIISSFPFLLMPWRVSRICLIIA